MLRALRLTTDNHVTEGTSGTRLCESVVDGSMLVVVVVGAGRKGLELSVVPIAVGVRSDWLFHAFTASLSFNEAAG